MWLVIRSQALQEVSGYKQEAIQVQGLQSRVKDLNQQLLAATEAAQARQLEVTKAQDKCVHLKRKLTQAEKVSYTRLN